MANRIFAITVAHEAITLDDQGRAQVSLTVSNTGPKSLVGRAKLIPLGSTKEAWLTLDGEPERNFSKGESHQLTVKIAVPPGTPKGKYSFRLNVVSVENPDDDFTEGPSVSFEVKELAPAAPPPRKFPWWIVAVAGVLVLGATIITWLLLPGKATVPNVVGEPVDRARELLKDFAYEEAGQQVTGKSKANVVIEQNPAGGAKVAKGTKVAVTIEADSVSVPKLVGRSVEDARALFGKSRLELKTEARSAGKPPGTVVDQQPKGDELVAPKTVVTAFVEPEPQMVEVPDVFGLSVNQAAAKFQEKKLEYKENGRVITGKVPIGAIASQSPAADQRVPVGTKVTLTIEANSVEVPNLIGKTVGQAFSELGSLGFVYKYKFGPTIQSMPMWDTVVWQSPGAGTRVAPAATVTVSAEPQ